MSSIRGRVTRLGIALGLAVIAVGATCLPVWGPAYRSPDNVAWSRLPPAGLAPSEVPQFVSITFDNNFGLEARRSVGGLPAILEYYRGKRNAVGSGNRANHDGQPIRATFFHTGIYLVPAAETVGDMRGGDAEGRNLAAWRDAAAAGHEVAGKTVHHYNGGVVPLGPDPCCIARNWSAGEWRSDIEQTWSMLTDPARGIGVPARNIVGFRAPYLGYVDAQFKALSELGFYYDSSVPNCFADDEDGTNCAWPYTLDNGSPDGDVLAQKFDAPDAALPRIFPKIGSHKGLWQVAPTTLVVPPDSVANQYAFAPGLRSRIAAIAPFRYPSLYEPSTGKIAGMDYAMLIDAKVSGDEMRAILEYNLDLHLAGNRSPLVLVAHSHLYLYSSPKENPDTPSAEVQAERFIGLTDFLNYARSKPQVRIVGTGDIVEWMHHVTELERAGVSPLAN